MCIFTVHIYPKGPRGTCSHGATQLAPYITVFIRNVLTDVLKPCRPRPHAAKSLQGLYCLPLIQQFYQQVVKGTSIIYQRMTKPTKWFVRPAKAQISLGNRPVWSESSLSSWRKLGSLASHGAHSEDSDQTGRMPRLIWVLAGRTCHFVGFVLRWLAHMFFVISKANLFRF